MGDGYREMFSQGASCRLPKFQHDVLKSVVNITCLLKECKAFPSNPFFEASLKFIAKEIIPDFKRA